AAHNMLPVVLVTALDAAQERARGLEAGADDFLSKPVSQAELLARVKSLLRICSLREEIEAQRMAHLQRFFSPPVAELIATGQLDPMQSHRAEITVVFLDLRGFTAFSDNAEPEEVMDLLRDYHAEMGKLIFQFEGTLERFVGDGIVVIFNDPLPCEDHGRKAVSMAIEMRDRVKELRIAWTKKGYDLDLGVGLATGYATLGTIGFEGRMDYSSVGNLPNLAARMCAEAKGGQILTDQKTMSRLEEFFDSEAFEEFQLKGLSRPVRVFNIVATKA
ncbi:MAG: adenylate/guanylate cyclase domain-containing protein, partial [Candidatus Binatia bacterium]